MSAPLRLVQVGLGGWGRDWTRIVRASADVEQSAFVDSNPEALALAAKGGADPRRCFPSLETALEAGPADAVLITTGVGGHAPVALAALEAGLPVLVEKPFAATLAQAQEVVRAAARRRLPLMVSQNYRFHPAPALAAQVVREERLGALGFVEVDFRRDNARPRPPATAHHALPDPLLMDMAIHHFDLMRFVLGRGPLRISCTAFNPPWSPFRDPAAAAAEIEFEGGVVVSYRGSWASSGPVTPWAGEWRMDAEGGEIRWTSRDEPTPDFVAVRQLGQDLERLALPELPHLDRAGALSEFAAAIREGRESASSGRENLPSLALAFAARLSAQERRPVELSELLSPQEDSA
ncbi:Gfo/Idh/MocA family protein [Deinococcus hopiensis]|uniref:Predicted dehydrogenase n=1 Tax=Deinococcus hopiensis KR-140 TaxID=695939 RepID=A0A1W1UIP4_9DEIO|nr:Gfo/Idh/MocA family oxidoreductase [Deinococcus hopiensis]SMB80691.1 Predicted dehydrogenase [Deinococcus hopiensis KR-140]